MTDFCTLINFAASSGSKISTPTFLHVMTSTMYRLLSVRFTDDTFNEMLRLGLLAFCSSAFLQWRSLDMVYEKLVNAFKRRLTLFLNSDAAWDLKLWLVMVGHLSLLQLDDNESLLTFRSIHGKHCQAALWMNARSTLQDLLWIPSIHDAAGLVILDRLR
jgi:hypothetical protein